MIDPEPHPAGDGQQPDQVEFHEAPTWLDVQRWRKAERVRLIEARLMLTADERAAMAARIAATLDIVVGEVAGRTVSLYWPFRGEPDLRPWLAKINDRGGLTALPVVVEKNGPLEFRRYRDGDALEKGVWNIPVPSYGNAVIPDIVIAPMTGIDRENYRLGYGGGFFDRTLAAFARKPLIIGVGYETQRIETIYPQPHDIAMDRVVTEAGERRIEYEPRASRHLRLHADGGPVDDLAQREG